MKPVLQPSLPHAAAPSQAPPPFELLRPARLVGPAIFASPHSGQFYPGAFLETLDVPLEDLRRTEDAFVDELFAGSVGLGAIQLRALYGRCYVDLNRDARELDADMFADGMPRAAGLPSTRVRAGLGCLPRIAASGRNIYKGKLRRADGLARLETVYDPYHACLAGEVERLLETWPHALLIDCHSMPSTQPGRPALPDIVLGDRFGSSCDHRLTSRVERVFRRAGYSVVRNAPYAGGHTTRRYGRPRRGTHVLQIEIKRSLYMDEETLRPHRGFDRLKSDLDSVAAEIIDFAAQQES